MHDRSPPSSPEKRTTPAGRFVLLALVCAVLALCLHQGRRQFIRTFFVNGDATSEATTAPRGDGAAAPLRVILLDGLGESEAQRLPALSELCGRGAEFRVDTGFPTVSLPVQHSLWTGLTQAQSGVYYEIGRLSAPPKESLPAAMPDAVAVTESHVDIVASFGFSSFEPADESGVDETWRHSGFAARAEAALASSASLVFVHVLRIDEAGHAHGADSDAYRKAADDADAWLARWVPATTDANWIVLADHGHLPTGGHASRDANIPFVRACVFGPDAPKRPAVVPTVHLVDLSHELFRLAGREPTPGSAGRPLELAAQHYVEGEHIPTPHAGRYLLGLLLIAAAALASVRWGAGSWPWWFGAAYVCFLLLRGPPTLSMPAVYPPLGRDAALYAAAAWPLLAWALARAPQPPSQVLLRLLALPSAFVLASLVLCWGRPPLRVHVTAHASVMMVWLSFGLALCALAMLGRALGQLGRNGPPA